MRNDNISKTILSLVSNLPYFSIKNLKGLNCKDNYLRILLYRMSKAGKIIKLKKGLYAAKSFVDNAEKKAEFSFYSEALAGILYPPAYLSLEYVLDKYGIMTEVIQSYTAITTKKTARFINNIGVYNYHTLKKELFMGFSMEKHGELIKYEASLAKALFDFLYIRKNILFNKDLIKELRLNLDELKKSDLKEFKKYIKLEGSKKMKLICKWILSI